MEAQKLQKKIDEEEQWLRSVVIPQIIKDKKFENASDAEIRVGRIELKFIGPEEAFMLTNCYRATVEFYLQNNKHKRCLVVKKTPQLPPEAYDSINFRALFNNEVLAYTTIFPSIQNFMRSPFKVSKYYYSDLQKYFATIVLEDFGGEGWRVCKEKFNLSLEHILTAVKYLGEFHGIGFAMRAIKREEFDAITSNLKDARYECPISDEWALQIKVSLKRLIKVTRKHEPDLSEEFLEKLHRMLSTNLEFCKERVKPKEPFVTLCHGDFLRNNIAFQYQGAANDAKPIKTMMFDFQTLRLSSPMLDLVILLMLSAFAEVRHKYFEQIFQTYCDALKNSYETYADEKAPAYLSYDALLREFILFMPYGIYISSFFLALLVEPMESNNEEFFKISLEEIADQAMKRGGEMVNRELSHQMKEMFDFMQQYKVDIFKDIEF